MVNVKRYRFYHDDYSDCHCDIEEHRRGAYVSLEDYETLQKAYDKLYVQLNLAVGVDARYVKPYNDLYNIKEPKG